MRLRKKIVTAAAVVASVAGAVGIFATAASATVATSAPVTAPVTAGCHSGAYAVWCGNQTNANGLTLAIRFPAAGRLIAGSVDSTANSKFDFYWYKYGVANSENIKFAEYAPNGVASNLCLTEVNSGGLLTLQKCTGANTQQWSANSSAPSGSWQNIKSGDIIATYGGSNHFLHGVAVPVSLNNGENWTFNS